MLRLSHWQGKRSDCNREDNHVLQKQLSPSCLGTGGGRGNCARTWHDIDELLTVLAGEGSEDEGELDEDNFLIDELEDGSLALRGRRSGPSSRSGRRKSRSGRSGRKRWRPDARDGSPDTARQCFPAPSLPSTGVCAPMGV